MKTLKNHIISELEKQILPLQGLKKLSADNDINIGLRSIEQAFPNGTFPTGCMHEFINASIEDVSATSGFITCLLGKQMRLGGTCIWISTSRTLFPPALKAFCVEPHQVIFIDLKKERDIVYATEEALKCNRVTAVVSEIKHIDFKQSRRFQLAAEQSRVTGFLIRQELHIINTIACISRWCITSVPGRGDDAMPGVAFPRWHVELQKIRNGIPGKWTIEWAANAFRDIEENIVLPQQEVLRKIS